MSWYYPLSALINGLLSLIFSVYVLLLNSKKPLNRVFSLLAFSVALWNIPYFIWLISDSREAALFWVRVVMMGPILIATIFLHFILVLLNLDREKKRELITAYVFSGLFALSNLTPLFISDVRQKLFFPFWPDPGHLFHLHIIMFIICLVYAHGLMMSRYRFLSGMARNQLKYIFMSSLVSFLGGMTNYFLWYDIPVPPYGHCLVSIYIVLSGIAIIKYRLLDISIAIRRGLLFTAINVVVFSIPIAMGLIFEENISDIFGPRWWIGFFFAGGLFSYLAEMVYNNFRDRQEQRFQEEQRKYHTYLRDASSDLIYIRSMKNLDERIMMILRRGLRITGVMFYLLNEESERYELFTSDGNATAVHDRDFSRKSQIIQYLEKRKNALSLEDIAEDPRPGSMTHQIIETIFAVNRIELIIPVYIKGVLAAFIALGGKETRQHYTEDDINLLMTFANQIALAITNIRAEEALVMSEQKYYDLIQSLPEVIFELDREGRFTYINDRATDLLGYSRQEFLGMSSLDIVTDRARAQRGIDRTLVGGISGGREYALTKKDGTTLQVNLYTRNVYHNGEVMGISGLAVDLTEIKKARAALQESEEKFRTMIERSSEMITIIDAAGIIQYQSQSSERIIGYKPDELMGKDLYEYIHKDDIQEVARSFTGVVNDKDQHFVVEYRFRNRGGAWRHFESTGTNMTSNRLIRGIIVNTRDITQRKDAEIIMQKREERYRSLYNNALVAMLTTDIDTTTVITSNDLGHKIFGFNKKEDIIGISFYQLFADNSAREALYKELKGDGLLYNREVLFKKKDGTVFWAAISQRMDVEKEVVETVIIDITKRKLAEQQAHNLTFYDQLTGLANRESLLSHIKSETARMTGDRETSMFAVLCLGVDRLTNINTMYGRNAGDQILVEISNLLKAAFKENALVSRFEGDKFAIYFSKLKPQEDFIRSMVKKASETVSEHTFTVDEHAVTVTASIGVSIYPNDSDDPEAIVKNSEAAMYIAKEQGDNSFSLFDTRMYSDMLARIQLERELQEAIDRCQFYVYYQPKVDSSGTIAGMEALIRWDSPRRGMVRPAEFIPLIEKNGMIHEIGAIVLRKSLQQAWALKEKGHPDLMVAVNLSPIQFSHPDIIRLIEDSVIQSGYDPYWLELEITESSIMKEEIDSIGKLKKLHDMGISIAIDDFGTGYSSLSKLKDYPIDTLKIDKTFVESLPLNKKSAALASTIIDLGHHLNFKVVAEGVETREQVDFLIQQKCDYFQGNYFSEPLSFSDLEKKIFHNSGNRRV
jgi:diguanylate cyclase (GGDEF)-like protein/PAS domain S-box-containing protein